VKYRVVVTVEQRSDDFGSWQDAGYRVPVGPEQSSLAQIQRVLSVVRTVEELVPSLSI
jgi:hypothetical protein